LTCDVIHAFVCASASAGNLITTTQQEYFQKSLELEQKYNAECSVMPGFAVVVQPFMNSTVVIPEFVTPFMAMDCFHFSTKGHMSASAELWNNMMEKVGQKDAEWDPTAVETLKCPKEEDFIWTPINSV